MLTIKKEKALTDTVANVISRCQYQESCPGKTPHQRDVTASKGVQELYQELGESFRTALSTDTLASSNICFLLVKAVVGHMDFFIMIIFNFQKIKIIYTDFSFCFLLAAEDKTMGIRCNEAHRLG